MLVQERGTQAETAVSLSWREATVLEFVKEEYWREGSCVEKQLQIEA